MTAVAGIASVVLLVVSVLGAAWWVAEGYPKRCRARLFVEAAERWPPGTKVAGCLILRHEWDSEARQVAVHVLVDEMCRCILVPGMSRFEWERSQEASKELER